MLKILGFMSVFLIGCSDKISKSDVAPLVNRDVLVGLSLGEEQTMWDSTIKIYKENLEKKGLINLKITKKVTSSRNIFGDISRTGKAILTLTEKGKEYIAKVDTNGVTFVRGFTIEFDKIKNVHETPSLNIAEVEAIIKYTKKTPFHLLKLINAPRFRMYRGLTKRSVDDTVEVNITFEKTYNGWISSDKIFGEK